MKVIIWFIHKIAAIENRKVMKQRNEFKIQNAIKFRIGD